MRTKVTALKINEFRSISGLEMSFLAPKGDPCNLNVIASDEGELGTAVLDAISSCLGIADLYGGEFSIDVSNLAPPIGGRLWHIDAQFGTSRSGEIKRLASGKPNIMLIDQPELGISPRYHCQLIRELQEISPETQFFVATLSDEIYDMAMSFERHFIVRGDDQRTVFRKTNPIEDAASVDQA